MDLIYREKYILGITSLWLFIPFFYNTLYSNIIIYKLILFIATTISTIFWGYFSYYSLIHKLDNLFATILFIILFCFSYKKLYLLLSLICGVFYLLSNYFFFKNNYFNFIICHLIFRYIGFWWTMIILSNCIITFKIYIFYSLCYILHICYLFQKFNLYKITNKDLILNNFTKIYNNDVVLILMILFTLFFSHLIVIEFYN